jgi:hypothetical protein
MMWGGGLIALQLLVCFLTPTAYAQAQTCPPLSQAETTALRAEHLFGGQPSPARARGERRGPA